MSAYYEPGGRERSDCQLGGRADKREVAETGTRCCERGAALDPGGIREDMYTEEKGSIHGHTR